VCDFSLSRKNKTDTAPKGDRRKKKGRALKQVVHACASQAKREVSGESKIYMFCELTSVCVAVRFESARSQLFAIVKVARLKYYFHIRSISQGRQLIQPQSAAFSIRQHLVRSPSALAGRAPFSALELIYYNPTPTKIRNQHILVMCSYT
jgi:hypothetical protein